MKRKLESWQVRFAQPKKTRADSKRVSESLHRAHVNFQRERLAPTEPGAYSDLKTHKIIHISTHLECPVVRGERFALPTQPFELHWIASQSRLNVRPNFWKGFKDAHWFMLYPHSPSELHQIARRDALRSAQPRKD